MTQEQAAWRRYLDDLIRRLSAAEKQRLYTEIGVSRTTVQRWRNGENTADPSHIHRLLKALPEQERNQLRLLMQEDPTLQLLEAPLPAERPSEHIPFQIYEEILQLARNAPNPFWLLGGTLLFHALTQLRTTEDAGLEMIIAGCMPPKEHGKIRSLRALGVRGTAPWRTDFHMQERLFGVESLAGYVVMRRHSLLVPDTRDPGIALPLSRQEQELSCAAAPLMWSGKIAGALLATSNQPHFFTEEKLRLLERYADLVCLALSQQDFVDRSYLDLATLPGWQIQHTYFNTFRQRVNEEYKRSVQHGSLQELAQVEVNVRQTIEGELLQLTPLAHRLETIEG
ncbi:hypothetical protein KDA_49290 [Dictyobacter alpinus]|uniref:HTH cro/C1-type domain-containing protein n=1 Tax=Dictyobacter alpinus TaxID=2014873 RepID=A0A402BDL8_9CHLR|nr:GAF domain-containing protein [Dictyobacter alpinus]GCE29445.1 hypothetical protein KDA_49290 [Dictyobacter alpinus]